MKRRLSSWTGLIFGFLIVDAGSKLAMGQPTAAAIGAFNSYVEEVELRLAEQHRSHDHFLASVNEQQLRRGGLIVEQIQPAAGERLPGVMLHHWRGTAFAPGATAADFERLLHDFSAYPRNFAPQVLQARVTAQRGDRIQAVMRVRQKHVITVVMDTAYDINWVRSGEGRGYSVSRSTRISEIDSGSGRALSPENEHGFLWRMNTYWSYEEHDGGLSMQIESVSLTRSIPRGLGWVVGPFVESVPRESVEFTLRSACNAIRK